MILVAIYSRLGVFGGIDHISICVEVRIVVYKCSTRFNKEASRSIMNYSESLLNFQVCCKRGDYELVKESNKFRKINKVIKFYSNQIQRKNNKNCIQVKPN